MSEIFTGFAFQFVSRTLRYILQALTQRYIDKNAAPDEICTYRYENICEGTIAKKITMYVLLSAICFFQWPETSTRCFWNNRPCFLILEESELVFTSPTQDMKLKLFNKKKTLLVYLMTKFRGI